MRSFVAVGLSSLALSGCMFVFDREPAPDDEPSDPPMYPDAGLPGANYGALCDAPDGPALGLSTVEVAAALTGQWWRCAGADEFRGQNVEFSPDLNFYLLTEVNGDFVRNLGPSTSGTYVVLDRGNGIELAIETYWGDGLDQTYPLVGYITTNPRKMQLGGGRYVLMP